MACSLFFIANRCLYSISPEGVRDNSLFLYANNVVLYCFSKKWMCCDTAGGVRFNCLAAVVKFKVLHTVRNVFVR